MKTTIFNLQIVPIKNVFPHEEYDQSRAKPLVKRLKADGCLVNPIIVAELGGGCYLQLDGMNRFSAFKMMGFSTILAQIIDYNDQDVVELSSWTHLFHIDGDNLFLCAREENDINVRQGTIDNVGHRYIKEEGAGRLCTVISNDKKVYILSTSGSLVEKIKKLNNLVSCYKDNIVRDVLSAEPSISGIEFLFREHPDTNMMMVFPTFTRHQIVDVIKHHQLLPPGVTRHIIKRRCLNVRMPLSFFSKGKSLKEKNADLEKILSRRAFRLYEEPTVYFE